MIIESLKHLPQMNADQTQMNRQILISRRLAQIYGQLGLLRFFEFKLRDLTIPRQDSWMRWIRRLFLEGSFVPCNVPGCPDARPASPGGKLGKARIYVRAKHLVKGATCTNKKKTAVSLPVRALALSLKMKRSRCREASTPAVVPSSTATRMAIVRPSDVHQHRLIGAYTLRGWGVPSAQRIAAR